MIRRTTKIFLEIVAVFVAGLAVGGAFLGWRLSAGPVSLDFLTPYVESALAAPDGTFHTDIDRTVLSWGGWDRPVQIQALGLRAVDADGRVIAAVPEATVQLSASALMTGTVTPTGLEVLNPRLRLTRSEEGRFMFGIERGQDVQETGAFLPRLLETLAEDDGRPHLTRLHIVNAHLTIVDHVMGATWTAPRADLGFERDRLGIEASLSIELAGGGAPAKFDGVALYDAGARVIDIAFAFEDLDPGLFTGKGMRLGPLQAFSARLDGRFSAGITPEGAVRAFEFDVEAGKGSVTLPDELGGRTRFIGFSARGEARDGLERIELDSFRLDIAPSDSALLARTGDERAAVQRPPTIEGSGWLHRGEEETISSLRATVRDLPVDRLDEFWPLNLDPGGRAWVTANISGGRVDEVGTTVALRYTPDSRDPEVLSLHGALRYADLEVRFLPGLPPATGVGGTATFDSRSLTFDVQRGAIADMPIGEATVKVDGLDTAQQNLSVDGTISGATSKVLAVLDNEPFRYARELGIDPAQVGGGISGRITTSFPLLDDLTFADVEIAANARVNDFTWRGALFGADVRDGALDLHVDKAGMQAEGELEIGGTPASIKWSEQFAGNAAYPQELEIVAVMTAAARSTVGLDLESHLSGPVPVVATIRSNRRNRRRIVAEADLGQASVTVPRLEWSKEAGAQGRARATMELDADGSGTIESFSVATPAWGIAGEAELREGGGLLDLTARLDKGEKNDASLVLQSLEDGGWVARLTGRAFDASGVLEDLDGSDASGGPPVMLTGSLERLYTAGNRYVAGVGISAATGAQGLERLNLRGTVGSQGKLAVEYGTVQGRQGLHVSSDDAGAALATFDLTDSILGGTLEINGSDNPAEGQEFRGMAAMRDFRVRDAPTLAKITSLASLAGIADALSGKEGMGFSELTVPFTAKDGVITIKDGRAIGPDLGITGSGTVSLSDETIDIDGTVVPAYTLNSILGEIPVLGDILVGEKGSGVFAATYSVSGPLGDPDVSANPLAALTPGFLRGLFDIFSRPKPGEGTAERKYEFDSPSAFD